MLERRRSASIPASCQSSPSILRLALVASIIVADGGVSAAFSPPISSPSSSFSKTLIQPRQSLSSFSSCVHANIVHPSVSAFVQAQRRQIVSLQNSANSNNPDDDSLVDRIATKLTNQFVEENDNTSSTTTSSSSSITGNSKSDRTKFNLITLLRVSIPSLTAGVIAYLAFPALALFLASIVNDAGVFAVLSQDSSQFVQNFLTVSGLLFSILIGQTYAFLYQQQEAVFYALFNEVTEAKSLLEQVALVCQGRPALYDKVLNSISTYVDDDLKQLRADPAVLISTRPIDDPLESIMYMTSVGVPSSVYETVRSLRQARASRLGALQRKLPQVHMLLLWILAGIELVSFPLLGAGTQTLGGYNILTVEGCLFGIMTFGIVMTMKVIGELYRPGGGAYNVDSVLAVMVKGLEEELRERLAGGRTLVANEKRPLAQYEIIASESSSVTAINTAVEARELPMETQGGGSVGNVLRTANRAIQFVRSRRKRTTQK